MKEKKSASTRKPVAKKEKTAGSDHKLYDLIMATINQEKADNVVSIDMTGKSAIADYMVIATGASGRHTVALAKKIRDKIAPQGYRAKIEGADTGDWVVLDAGDVIVHLFRAEVRQFYNLEKLWSADFSAIDYMLYKSQ